MIDFFLIAWLLSTIAVWFLIYAIIQRNRIARYGSSDVLTDSAASFILALGWPILLLVMIVDAMADTPRSNRR